MKEVVEENESKSSKSELIGHLWVISEYAIKIEKAVNKLLALLYPETENKWKETRENKIRVLFGSNKRRLTHSSLEVIEKSAKLVEDLKKKLLTNTFETLNSDDSDDSNPELQLPLETAREEYYKFSQAFRTLTDDLKLKVPHQDAEIAYLEFAIEFLTILTEEKDKKDDFEIPSKNVNDTNQQEEDSDDAINEVYSMMMTSTALRSKHNWPLSHKIRHSIRRLLETLYPETETNFLEKREKETKKLLGEKGSLDPMKYANSTFKKLVTLAKKTEEILLEKRFELPTLKNKSAVKKEQNDPIKSEQLKEENHKMKFLEIKKSIKSKFVERNRELAQLETNFLDENSTSLNQKFILESEEEVPSNKIMKTAETDSPQRKVVTRNDILNAYKNEKVEIESKIFEKLNDDINNILKKPYNENEHLDQKQEEENEESFFFTEKYLSSSKAKLSKSNKKQEGDLEDDKLEDKSFSNN